MTSVLIPLYCVISLANFRLSIYLPCCLFSRLWFLLIFTQSWGKRGKGRVSRTPFLDPPLETVLMAQTGKYHYEKPFLFLGTRVKEKLNKSSLLCSASMICILKTKSDTGNNASRMGNCEHWGNMRAPWMFLENASSFCRRLLKLTSPSPVPGSRVKPYLKHFACKGGYL